MPTDAKLVQAAQSGDEKAFETLVEKYRPRIYATISGFIKNTQDREDIAQETFINAYRNLHQLSKPDRFSYWLITIAQNQCRDWKRKNRPHVHTIPIDEVDENLLNSDDSPERKSRQAEQRQIIAQAIQSLPETERQIAQAHYLEGASHHELVDRHGISYQAVCVRLSRAKRKLAKRLGHLLTGVFVTPATTLKQIYSGGLTLMKIGTTLKITVAAIGIVALIFIGFIGSRQLLLSKDNQSPSVEAVEQTSDTTAQSVTQTDATRRGDPTTASPEAERPISEEERQQIKNFFSQLEESDAQSNADPPQPPTESESEIEPTSTDTDAPSSTTEQSAEDVMNIYIDAFKSLDFEVMGSLMIGVAKDGFEEAAGMGFRLMDPEELKDLPVEMRQMVEQQMRDQMLKHFSGLEIVSSKYVGDEFHFEIGGPPPEILGTPAIVISEVRAPNELYKMRKENGAWRIYESETLN